MYEESLRFCCCNINQYISLDWFSPLPFHSYVSLLTVCWLLADSCTHVGGRGWGTFRRNTTTNLVTALHVSVHSCAAEFRLCIDTGPRDEEGWHWRAFLSRLPRLRRSGDDCPWLGNNSYYHSIISKSILPLHKYNLISTQNDWKLNRNLLQKVILCRLSSVYINHLKHSKFSPLATILNKYKIDLK